MYLIARRVHGCDRRVARRPRRPRACADDGGVARSVALGLLLVTAGLLGARYGSPGDEQRVPDTDATR